MRYAIRLETPSYGSTHVRLANVRWGWRQRFHIALSQGILKEDGSFNPRGGVPLRLEEAELDEAFRIVENEGLLALLQHIALHYCIGEVVELSQ